MKDRFKIGDKLYYTKSKRQPVEIVGNRHAGQRYKIKLPNGETLYTKGSYLRPYRDLDSPWTFTEIRRSA